MSTTYSNKIRRPYAHMSSFLVNQLHLRNPWIPVWWSMAFPGGGHMMLCPTVSCCGLDLCSLAFIVGMVVMLLGAIYGFVLTWGPIIWGLIGMVAGIVVGLLIRLLSSGTKVFQDIIKVDVVLIVDCSESQERTVEQIQWGHQALGVAKTPLS